LVDQPFQAGCQPTLFVQYRHDGDDALVGWSSVTRRKAGVAQALASGADESRQRDAVRSDHEQCEQP
jgi:hypothetical protein